MGEIERILRSKLKPKQKQERLVEAVSSGRVPVKEFMEFFASAPDVDKGSCADVMKHLSASKPELLVPHVGVLVENVNHPLPRVKWGVPEALGNLARLCPDEVSAAVPRLLKNTVPSEENTTVVRWCAAFALSEILLHDKKGRERLLPKVKTIVRKEKNNGVRNVYLKALKALDR